MSLVTLTFGYGKEKMSYSEIVVCRPEDNIRVRAGIPNTVEVIKTATFYGQADAYLVTKITSGVVRDGMVGCLEGKEFKVIEVESKYGNVGKTGMTIGIMTEGLSQDEVQKGSIISFKEASA